MSSRSDTKPVVYPTLWVCPVCFEVRGDPGECQEVHNHPEQLEAGEPFPERVPYRVGFEADFWKNRYDTQHNTLHRMEDEQSRLVSEREKLAWVIRELHEGACSPAYRPPDSDYRLWALEVIEREASDVFPQPAKADPPPAPSESSHGGEA